MDRRSFIKGSAVKGAALAAATGTAAATTFAAPAYAQGKRDLKMVTTWPKNFPGLGTAANKVAEKIKVMTDGQIDIKVFAAGEFVGPFEAFDAVSQGSADIYHGAEYYWQGKSKAFNFFTSVPFGLNAAEMNAWLYYGGGQELWDELSAKFKIKAFGCANTGVQMGGWFNKEITNLEDFKGLKIRMPGLGGEVMRRLGAAALSLPGGEIFQSLQSGAIDATEWVGPWNDLAFGFYRAAKFYYWPGFHEPGALLSLGMNLEVWESLTEQQQAIVKAACAAQTEETLAEYNARNAQALRTLIDQHDVQLRRFPDEVFAAIGEVSGQVLKEMADEDDLTKRVYESFLKARKTGMEWGRLSEEAYADVRRLDYSFE